MLLLGHILADDDIVAACEQLVDGDASRIKINSELENCGRPIVSPSKVVTWMLLTRA
jgi:hypothetical protein